MNPAELEQRLAAIEGALSFIMNAINITVTTSHPLAPGRTQSETRSLASLYANVLSQRVGDETV